MKRKIRHKVSVFGFLTPGILGVMIFYIIPFALVIWYSFLNNPIQKEWVGLQNYQKLFQNQSFCLALGNTLKIIGIGLPVLFLLAFLLLKMLLDVLPSGIKYNTFFLLPLVVPTATVVLMLKVLFTDNGAVNQMLRYFGADGLRWLSGEGSFLLLLLVFLWKNLGLAVFFLFLAHNKIPREYIQIAQIESASGFAIFWKIKLHFYMPTMVFIAIFAIINSFKMYREIYALAGSHPVSGLYLLQHYLNNVFRNLSYQNMSTASMIICLILFLIIGIICLSERLYNRDYEKL